MESSLYSNPGAPTPRRDSNLSARRVKVIRPHSVTWYGLWSSINELAESRDLLWALSLHRLRVRYKQSALGLAWALIQPVALMLIYTLVFSVITKFPTHGLPYAVFAYAALLPWTYFGNALTNATNGLVSNAQLVTKVYFPREILPLSYIVAASVDLAVAALVMIGLMFYYHVALTWEVLWLFPVTLTLTAFVTGISLILSAMQVKYRDIGMGMPLLLQLWMFASPVVYSLSMVPSRIRPIYQLNPMVGLIHNFRAALLGQPLDFSLLLLSVAITFALLPLAFIYFKRVEASLADVI